LPLQLSKKYGVLVVCTVILPDEALLAVEKINT